MGDVFGGGSQDVETESQPWKPSHPYLTEGLSEAKRLYGGFSPEYYPYSTVASQNPYSQSAIDLTAQRALQGSPLQDAANQGALNMASGAYLGGPGMAFMGGPGGEYVGRTMDRAGEVNPAFQQLASTAQGDYLNSNPYLDSMYDTAARQVGESFSEYTMPGMQSGFSTIGAGPSRFSGEYAPAQQNQIGRQQEAFGRTLNDLATNIYGGNYARERGMQEAAASNLGNQWQNWLGGQQAAAGLGMGYGGQMEDMYRGGLDQMLQGGQLASDYANQDYADLGYLGRSGQQQEAYDQQGIDDAVNRFNFYQTGAGNPWEQLARYQSMATGIGGMGGINQQQGGGGSFLGDVLGLGMSGLGLAGGLGWSPFSGGGAQNPTISRTQQYTPWQVPIG